jgi:polo-like kinase 1
VNKKGERQTLPLSHALESNNAEMTKRLKYTKDILTHMLNNNNAVGGKNRVLIKFQKISEYNKNLL